MFLTFCRFGLCWRVQPASVEVSSSCLYRFIMRCSTLVLSVAALVVGSATAFAPARTAARSSRAHVLRMGASDEHDAAPSLVGAADRRGVLRAAALAGGALITEGVWGVPTARAAEIKKVVVAGATGQTGR